MHENIEKLKLLFKQIKDKEFNESLRCGTTGIGYTFESLLGKKEDSNYLPDFNKIEIKTKLGYSKSPITLFTLVPKKDNDSSISYVLNNFGYPDKNNDLKCFRGNVYSKYNNVIANRYIFKIKIKDNEGKLQLLIYDKNFNIIDDSIYWNLKDIETRLYTKLQYLAIIKGYPYKREEKNYYKYTSLSIYKLKGFNAFLKLLKEDNIFIMFNIGMHKSATRFGQICDRGTAFRIQIKDIEKLFDKTD